MEEKSNTLSSTQKLSSGQRREDRFSIYTQLLQAQVSGIWLDFVLLAP
jgi:acetone carboxylase gamma subunit